MWLCAETGKTLQEYNNAYEVVPTLRNWLHRSDDERGSYADSTLQSYVRDCCNGRRTDVFGIIVSRKADCDFSLYSIIVSRQAYSDFSFYDALYAACLVDNVRDKPKRVSVCVLQDLPIDKLPRRSVMG